MNVTMIVLDEPAGLFERLEHALNGLAKVVQLAPVFRASYYRAAKAKVAIQRLPSLVVALCQHN